MKESGRSMSSINDAKDGVAKDSEVPLKVKIGRARMKTLWRRKDKKRAHISELLLLLLQDILEITSVIHATRICIDN